jgi:D-citramalate synthase
MRQIEIMDTTLRDGEQMQGISFTPSEKLTIAEILLSKVKVDRLEITSARVSDGEQKGVGKIVEWADKFGFTDKLEILTFIDYDKSINWAVQSGVKCINLLTKGSLKHCEQQLKKTQKEHQNDIERTLEYAFSKNINVNVYLEDFSNGIINSPEYLFSQIDFLKNFPIKRIMLPDTLGIMNPFSVFENIKEIVERYPTLHFDFHPHNDYGLGTANALAAIKAGAKGVHLAVNGMGERAGNASLDEVCVSIKDFLDVQTNIDEKELFTASKYVETFSGQRMPANKAIYGKNIFTQTAGVHADGDKKGDLYVNNLKPERFGRHREYALGKLSGKANLEMNLKELGISLSEEKKNILLQTIIELGDNKKTVFATDLPFIINDIFETKANNDFKVLNFSINSTYKLKSIANVRCSFRDKEAEEAAQGDGGYDAFMNALKKILIQFEIQIPKLIDYTVEIPPGGRTNAMVQAVITWEVEQADGKMKKITTKGMNHDQNTAAIEATLKIINFIS